MHMLLRDEPHPDSLATFADHLRWAPATFPAGFLDHFHHATAQLSPVQRLAVKLIMRMRISDDEIRFLADLHSQGKYRSDPNPVAYFLCMGRRSGKTTISQVLDSLYRYLSEVHHQFNMQRKVRATDLVGLVGNVTLDEMLAMEWGPGVDRLHGSQRTRFVGLFTPPRNLRMLVSDKIPSMVMCLDTRVAIPNLPYSSDMQVHRDEYEMPQVSTFLVH
jgi:hypothetical protein